MIILNHSQDQIHSLSYKMYLNKIIRQTATSVVKQFAVRKFGLPPPPQATGLLPIFTPYSFQ